MRTKTLLIAAAALAAAVTSSNAQTTVYSQNIVGYVNVTLPANQFSMVVNPLSVSNTTASAETILPSLQAGDSIYVWNGATYNIYQFFGPGTWLEPDGATFGAAPNLSMSQGFFYLTGGAIETNTFTGTVILTNSVNLPANSFSMIGSVSPIGVSAEDPNLGLPLQAGDSIYQFVNGNYNIYQFFGPGTWLEPDGATFGAAPTVGVGQGFFYLTGGTPEVWNQSTVVQ